MAKIRPMLGADLFCGAGGSSTGARRALRRLGIEMTLVAVNHWPVAIKTHQRNHPDARHYCVNLDAARPIELVPEGYLDLLMASPECTHHSRARGGKPMNDQSRMSAWHVVRWCTELRVKRLLVENVEEFLEWGPLNPRTNRPVKSRKGEYFLAFVRALEGIGFKVEWGVLNAADFGEATTRRRLFMMARSDGKPIVWPQPTHSKEGGSDLFGTISKWRVAREIIDWEQSGRSIFTRKKPLQPKTMARILAGARKFNWPEPFIRALRNIMDSPSEKQPTEEMGGDLLTLQACSFQEAHSFILNRHGDNGGVRASEVGQPMPTATCRGAGYLVQTELKPFVLAQGSSGAPRDVDEPMPTIVGAGAISVTTPVLVNLKGRSSASSVDAPTPTLTAHARHLALAEPFLYPVNQGGDRQGCHRSAESPLPDLLTRSSLEIPRAMIAPFYGSGSGRTCKSVEAPLDTITGRGHFAVVKTTAQPFVVSPRHGGKGFGPAPRSTEQPLPTIKAGGSQSALVEAALVPFLVPQFGERPGQGPRVHGVDQPLPSPTSHGAGALVQPYLVSVAHGDGCDENAAKRRSFSIESPLPTITAGGGEFSVIEPSIAPLVVQTDQTGSNGTCVRSATEDPLLTPVTKQNHAIVTTSIASALDCNALKSAIEQGRVVVIDGIPYVIDILFRMLEPYELARGMGFSDEESQYEFVGNKGQVVKQIGNAVSVRTACALVGALFHDQLGQNRKDVQPAMPHAA